MRTSRRGRTLCGAVLVGDGAPRRRGRVVSQGIRTGRRSLVGAGAVVLDRTSPMAERWPASRRDDGD